jgi:hypothetical protein
MKSFKPIVGYEESYAINQLGEVMSLTRTIPIDAGQVTRVKECRLRTWINSKDQQVVQLCKKSKRQIHTTKSLIEKAFNKV